MFRPFVFLVALALVQPSLRAAPQAQAFTRYDGCKYIPQPWNDGDSFHVRMPDGKEQVLRLYFVDTPESEESFPERIAEQATYFSISSVEALRVGKKATTLTKAALSKPFSVQTRWHTARGRSNLPRFYAVITTADGKDLGELLVRNGLARVYGTRTPLPDGRDSRTYLTLLAELEAKANLDGVGGWKK